MYFSGIGFIWLFEDQAEPDPFKTYILENGNRKYQNYAHSH
jgi:hypothetical protein